MKSALAALFFLVLGGFLSWLLAPALWTDFNIQSTQRLVAQDVQVDEARCRTKLFILSFCTIKLSSAGATGQTEFNYFLLSSLGGEPVVPMRTIGTREVLTTSVGMDYLTNRIVSFAAFAAFMLLMVFGGLRKALRAKDR